MKKTLLYLTFLILSVPASAQKIALKMNALMYAMGTPNIECELVTGERTSLSLAAFGHWKPYGIDSKLAAFQPEFRFWFNGRPMVREYLGVTLLGTTYDIHLKQKVFNGDAVGLGITMGYSLPLSQRWNVEFSGGFGAIAFWQKRYFDDDLYDDAFANRNITTNSRGYKLLPIKLAVSFTYILK